MPQRHSEIELSPTTRSVGHKVDVVAPRSLAVAEVAGVNAAGSARRHHAPFGGYLSREALAVRRSLSRRLEITRTVATEGRGRDSRPRAIGSDRA